MKKNFALESRGKRLNHFHGHNSHQHLILIRPNINTKSSVGEGRLGGYEYTTTHISIYNQHKRAALRPVWNNCIWTSKQKNFITTLVTSISDMISVIYKYFVLFSSKQIVLKYYSNEESWQFLQQSTIRNTTISEIYLPKIKTSNTFLPGLRLLVVVLYNVLISIYNLQNVMYLKAQNAM